MRRIDGTGSVEISIFLLCRADFFDQCVEIRFEFGVGRNAERVGCALNHFINISVVEWIWWVFVIFKRLAAKRLGSANEVVDASGLFIFLERERNGDLAI